MAQFSSCDSAILLAASHETQPPSVLIGNAQDDTILWGNCTRQLLDPARRVVAHHPCSICVSPYVGSLISAWTPLRPLSAGKFCQGIVQGDMTHSFSGLGLGKGG